jgi:PKD domain
MNPKGTPWLAAILQLVALTSLAQHADTVSPAVNFHIADNVSSFNADLRPLHRIAGAPAPFYTYLWEFGDGKFSFEAQPSHVYVDTGSYNVRLYATNNYDDGKPPPTRPKSLNVKSKTLYAKNNEIPFFKQDGSIEMKVNRMPKPDEDMVLIIGYRNRVRTQAMKGSLVLFYNERQFKKNNFDLTDERAYYQERKSSRDSLMAYLPSPEIMETTAYVGHGGSFIAQTTGLAVPRQLKFADLFTSKLQVFRQTSVWRFENLQKGEEKYFFLTLHTTPEMIKDTNAVVTVTGMFVPDGNDAQIEEYEMELQIVASHDPNRMLLKNRRLNYRFIGTNKELTYRVIFQNSGKGPAHNISVGISVPSMLDPQSVEMLDYQPKCPLCDSSSTGRACLEKIYKKDSIHFVFKNIYLPGILQDGMRDPDSTKGFLKYRVHFNSRLKKLPFDSRAAIVFDGQEPVYSNPSRGDFKPGKSWGLMAGYGMHRGDLGSNDASDNNFSIGASLSPYAPYRKYLQAEVFLSYQNYPDRFVNQGQSIDTIINGTAYSGFGTINQKNKTISLDIVPVQLRYNLNDFLGLGVGTQVTADAFSRISPTQVFYLFDSTGMNPIRIQKKQNGYNQWFKKWDFALFGDVQLGQVRAGPALGIRYLHYFRQPQNRFFIYADWRL